MRGRFFGFPPNEGGVDTGSESGNTKEELVGFRCSRASRPPAGAHERRPYSLTGSCGEKGCSLVVVVYVVTAPARAPPWVPGFPGTTVEGIRRCS